MRIGIVNDLLLAREALRRVVASVPGYSVAWVAEDGAAACAWPGRTGPTWCSWTWSCRSWTASRRPGRSWPVARARSCW